MLSLFGTAAWGGTTRMGDGPEFDTFSWDFGKILERDGIVSHTFVMTNTTGKDLQIINAVPSCSCTWVEYSKDVIHPGEKAEIEVKYTPSGAMGKVYREVQLYGADNRTLGVLEISADVEPADRTIPERYPFTLAPFLYTNLNHVPFGYVYHGTEKTKMVYLANSSGKPLRLKVETTDKMLALRCPEVLEPGQEVELTMTYRTPQDANYYDYVIDSLYLTVNGEKALNPIVLSMIALDRAEVGTTAPFLRSYPSTPRLKKKGKTWVARMELHNDGDGPLEIRGMKLPDNVLTANMARGESIAQGKKKTLELVCKAEEGFRMCIFSNDPVRPMKEIRVTGQLKK